MRKRQKRNINKLMGTFQEAHKEIRSCLENGRLEKAGQLLAVCQDGISSLSSILEKEQSQSSQFLENIDTYYRQLYEMDRDLGSIPSDTVFWSLNKTIEIIADTVEKEFPVTYEILFLPYKASMWDSFESIWKEASMDPRCDCYVVPIPYYELGMDGKLESLQFEGGLFPLEVQVKSFLDYKLEEREPDVIYFHNPYDQCNLVTRVFSNFFSDRLKQYTNMLVFVPYFVEGNYLNEKAKKSYYGMSAHRRADLVVAQSPVQARFFIEEGCDKEKVLALGSPKLDAVLNHQNDVRPKEWVKVLEGKKVFLLNTSIATFLRASQWLDFINEIVEWFGRQREYALIWRPHPLLGNSIKATKPSDFIGYQKLEDKISSMENGLMDNTALAYSAIACSDALISDYSSLAMQYCLTGKPVLMLTGKSQDRDATVSAFDYFSCYFMEDGMELQEFCGMVKSGCDEKAAERLDRAVKSVVNGGGGCGRKVHEAVMREIEKKSL